MLTRAKTRSENELAQQSKIKQQSSPASLGGPLDTSKSVCNASRSERASVRSTSKASVVTRKLLRTQLELEAAEEKARLLATAAEAEARLEELRMHTKMEETRMRAKVEAAKMQALIVEKRLDASLAEIDEQRSRAGSSMTSSARRTAEWVARQNVSTSRMTATQNERHPDFSTPAAEQDGCQTAPAAYEDGEGSFSAPNMSVPLCAPTAQGNVENHTILKLVDAVHKLALGCAQSSQQATVSDKILSRLATPKELPMFRGDPLEWVHFKCFYEESTQACQFSNAENLCRLRKSLQGEARECVVALLMGKVSAESIIKTLELRFGRPEIIITKIVSQIRKIPSLSLSYHNDIVSFSIKIKNCVAAVKSIKQDDYLRSPELTTAILSKLPCSLITRWADYVHTNYDKSFNMTRLELISEFLEKEAQKISDIGVFLLYANSVQRKTDITYSNFHKPQLVLAHSSEAQSQVTQKGTAKCRFCFKRSDHVITECPKFKRALRKERWHFVRSNRLCPKCLVSDHNKETCDAPVCNIENCGLPHHTILHWPHRFTDRCNNASTESVEADNADKRAEAEPIAGETPNVCLSNVTATEILAMSDPVKPTSSQVLLKYVRVQIHGPNGDVVIDALLDDGSTITMIDSSVAEKAGLKGCTESLKVRGAWDSSVLVCQTELIGFDISGQDFNRYRIVARTVDKINLPIQHFNSDSYEHLSLINCYLCSEPMKPLMIIGQDNYHLLAPLEVIEGDPNATRTVLGWAIHGNSAQKPRAQGVTNAYALFMSGLNQSKGSLDELNELVRRSYALDALGVSTKTRQCSEDLRALKMLDATSKQVGDHWEVGLPWKDDSVKMKNSYPTAYKRLQGVEKKMKINPDFQCRYRERVQHLLVNKYAHLYEEAEGAPEPDRLWYLPHFGVDNPNKKKLRLVFDAAAKSQGYSLNDYLLQGPDLLVSLIGILFRFREHRVAVTGDIKDMFLRVQIRKEDQHATRFLWRDDITNNKPPLTYVMNSLIFGACCSPFVAQYVKNKNAQLYIQEKPRAVTSIIQNHYVDDLMDSIETEDAALQLVQDVRDIHMKGGFEIRNWTSNSKKVLASLPEADLGPSAVQFNMEGVSEGERTLGLYWFPADDVLAFDVSLKRISENILTCFKRPTKREMLSVIMSVFDVQGFLAPISIKSRILLQDVWRSGLAWDEPVKDKEFAKWRKWLESVERLKSLRIPRWYLNAAPEISIGAKVERELHVFCDASPQAYAAVAYWRILVGANIYVSFIASKSRVAPLRPVSVPRMELQGAVLACRLAVTIEHEHTVKPDKRFFWTDSSTVLLWISSDARNYKPFVANRLGEIDEHSKSTEWRYVPTAMNVADFATKEDVHDLQYDHQWFHGPQFLSQEEFSWPDARFTRTSANDEDLELKKQTVCALIVTAESMCIPNPVRFSSWTRLLRATAAVLVAVERFKRKESSIDFYKLKRAEVLILKLCQSESFPEELEQLKENKPLRKSRLLKLSPYVDNEGVLRIQGRIDAAEDVSIETKRPVILDGRHYVSDLIIGHYHKLFVHANNETVVNELRQRYWIIRLRPSVRRIASRCLLCRIRKATPVIPRQGDLPAGRIAHSRRPFSHCGLDLFGPIDVTVGRRRDKRYGVIFTCMTVRAIHLEIVSSLSTDSLIMAMRRMAARRGWPTDFYSDNGTNLRGAYAELQTLQTVQNWHFNPPLSPHMGGAWERLIRSVKTALKVVMKERAPRDETLATLMCEVEAMVNSRPLTHVSVSPFDNVALTPFHFLLGTSSNLPITSSHSLDLCSRKQWRVAQRLADMFWARWLKEVLPCLAPRTMNSTNDCHQLKVGDDVLVVDAGTERGYWPRGKIEKIYPGADNRVRVVDVKTSRGTLRRRCVQRLVSLPSNPRGEEC